MWALLPIHPNIYLLQASDNLGMAMIYTLVTSAQEWLSENYGHEEEVEELEETDTAKEDVWLFVLLFFFPFFFTSYFVMIYVVS